MLSLIFIFLAIFLGIATRNIYYFATFVAISALWSTSGNLANIVSQLEYIVFLLENKEGDEYNSKTKDWRNAN